MAVIYFVFMIGRRASAYRVPPTGWRPRLDAVGWSAANAMITQRHVHLRNAHDARRSSGCCGGLLCFNVSAGIGVIGMASPMLQEIFGGR